jgi:hypothetical protein
LETDFLRKDATMAAGYGEAEIIPFRPRPSPDLGDVRFRTLVGEAGWAQLPAAVRARFSRRLGGGATIVYAGEIVEATLSRCGRLIANLARLIGGPLPLSTDTGTAAAVSVAGDEASGGQFWTRIYGRRRGFPQVISSVKRFAGPTGLEEYIGRGIGIALVAKVENRALHFVSDHYFLALGRLRLRLPGLLSPGRLTVSHIDCNHGWFAFMLVLDHPRLGTLVRQTALFQERVRPGRDGA